MVRIGVILAILALQGCLALPARHIRPNLLTAAEIKALVVAKPQTLNADLGRDLRDRAAGLRKQ